MAPELWRLRAIVHQVRPDVVHLHASKAATVGRLFLRGHVPTIVQPQGWSFRAVEGAMRHVVTLWERLSARWADVILCASQGELDRARDAGIRGNLRVVHNAIDVERFPRATTRSQKAARAQLGLGDGAVAVCVGRVCRQKGQDVLVDAWPQVRSKVPGAELILVGDGPDVEAIASRATDGVRLVGRQDDYVRWMHAADLVVLPSRWEGQSLTLLAALACGRSIVATEVEGMPDAVGPATPDRAGAIVAVDDADALAGAVVERLLDPVAAAREGEHGRARAERDYDLERWADIICRITLEILAVRR